MTARAIRTTQCQQKPFILQTCRRKAGKYQDNGDHGQASDGTSYGRSCFPGAVFNCQTLSGGSEAYPAAAEDHGPGNHLP